LPQEDSEGAQHGTQLAQTLLMYPSRCVEELYPWGRDPHSSRKNELLGLAASLELDTHADQLEALLQIFFSHTIPECHDGTDQTSNSQKFGVNASNAPAGLVVPPISA
jgi:hypothetical protein